MKAERALAMMNMLIFLLLFSILSGIILSLVSSHTKLLERHVRRVKSYYLAEAGTVVAMDAGRRGVVPPSSLALDWGYDIGGSSTSTKPVVMSYGHGAGWYGTTVINATSDYTINW